MRDFRQCWVLDLNPLCKTSMSRLMETYQNCVKESNIMKTLTNLLAILAVAALGQSAFGVTYLYKTADFVDQKWWYPDVENLGTEFSGQFDITSSAVADNPWDKFGFDPIFHTIQEVELLYATSGGLVEVRLGYDQDTVGLPPTPALSLSDIVSMNAVLYYFNSGDIGGTLLLQLQETGILDWHIVIEGTVEQQLYAASLAVNAPDSSSSIAFDTPDSGASLGLLLIGIFSLIQFNRRLYPAVGQVS